MRYDTLAQLQDAYTIGDLSRDESTLVIDNNYAAVYGEDGEKVFEMHPSDLLDQALTMLGIPHGAV